MSDGSGRLLGSARQKKSLTGQHFGHTWPTFFCQPMLNARLLYSSSPLFCPVLLSNNKTGLHIRVQIGIQRPMANNLCGHESHMQPPRGMKEMLHCSSRTSRTKSKSCMGKTVWHFKTSHNNFKQVTNTVCQNNTCKTKQIRG